MIEAAYTVFGALAGGVIALGGIILFETIRDRVYK